MSDKRARRKTCGRCARVSKRDLGRRFCPVTAKGIYENKPAESCRFYVEDEELRDCGSRRKGDDVFD